MKKLLAVCLLLAGLAGFPGAQAQQLDSRDAIKLRDQILELQQEVQALRDQQGQRGGSSLGGASSGAAGAADPELMTQLLERVQRLEESSRTLSGRIDEERNARQRATDDLAKQIGDLNFRLDNPGVAAPARPAAPVAAGAAAGAAAGSATMSPPPSSLGTAPSALPPLPVPPAPPGKRTPEIALRDGNAALLRKDYVAADAAAHEVLDGPKGPRTTDAQFLLAQSLYGRKKYTEAAVAFDDTYKRGRTGAHAPDSLLGLANALTALDERKAACETLDKLRAEFPTQRPDLKDPAAAARKAANCR